MALSDRGRNNSDRLRIPAYARPDCKGRGAAGFRERFNVLGPTLIDYYWQHVL